MRRDKKFTILNDDDKTTAGIFMMVVCVLLVVLSVVSLIREAIYVKQEATQNEVEVGN